MVPREAIALGAADAVAPLSEIAPRIMTCLDRGGIPTDDWAPVRTRSRAGGTAFKNPPPLPLTDACAITGHGRMTMQTIVEGVDDKVSIRLTGRFDFSAHRAFRESYAESLRASGVKELEIDLGGVDYMDSSALGMLLMLREKAQAANKRVSLANCRARCARYWRSPTSASCSR